MHHSVVAINENELIITGGTGISDVAKDVELLNIKKTKNAITKLPKLVSPRWGHSSVILNDYLYIIGGDDDTSVHRLDVSNCRSCSTPSLSNCWEIDVIPRLENKRMFTAVVVHEEYIYVFGGLDDGTSLSSCIRYRTPASSSNYLPAQSWEEIAEMKTKRFRHAAVKVGEKIYIIGGLNGDMKRLKSMEIYDLSTNKFEEGPKLPFPLQDMTALSIGNYIIVNGGKGSMNYGKVPFLFDTKREKWIMIDSPLNINTPRSYYASSVVQKNKILICGGLGLHVCFIDTIELVPFDELLYGKRWDRRERFVILRYLVDHGKAWMIDSRERKMVKNEKEESRLSCFRHLIMNADDDVFRMVLLFL